MTIIRVALNVPMDTLFDYIATDASIQDIGTRVSVPFGNKQMTGIIMAVGVSPSVNPDKLKPVQFIFRDIPPLPLALLGLFRFCSSYYVHPIGKVILNSLPSRLRSNRPIKPIQAMHSQFQLTDMGHQIDIASIPARNTVMRRLFLQLKEVGTLSRTDAKQLSSRVPQLLKEWVNKGWIKEISTPPSIPAIAQTASSIPVLTADQENAVKIITAESKKFDTWLLQGVTGSGKTEVYLRLISHALSQGKQTLVLVPEINLTPQLETIFRTRFPTAPLVSLHSGLNDSERMIGWLQAQRGEAKIILGTRLAVFTPLPKLGLVIVDEEQDSSFKQQDGLRYSARDIAIFRSRHANIPVVLGSATPSLESYYNAINGRYRRLCLTSRAVKNAVLPTVHCINTRITKINEGVSEPLMRALRECLAQKRQSLVFINRRGYAPVLLCKSCAWTATCRRCSSRLVVHLHEKKLRCHHCGHQESLPLACSRCGEPDIVPFGHGTQRVEAILKKAFPNARILRIDRDSIRRKNAWQTILQDVKNEQVDILIGTQLLAKGHDFPNLSLVCILNSDASLYSTDFRASERLFAQLMQVAGRAGRADIAGHVFIQTEFPEHLLYQALKQHNYDSLAKILLAERKTAGFPPFVYQAILRAEAHDIKAALDFLTKAAMLIKPPQNVEIFDPVPAQMMRLKGLERAHLLVQSASRKKLQEFLSEWYTQLNLLSIRKVRWALDVDPLEF